MRNKSLLFGMNRRNVGTGRRSKIPVLSAPHSKLEFYGVYDAGHLTSPLRADVVMFPSLSPRPVPALHGRGNLELIDNTDATLAVLLHNPLRPAPQAGLSRIRLRFTPGFPRVPAARPHTRATRA